MVGPKDCKSQCLAFKTNKLVHQILVAPNKPCITSLMYKTNHVTNPPHLLEEMGNCVPVHKTQDSASNLKCSSTSLTECILIELPVRENSIGTAIPRASSFQEPSGKEFESDREDFFSVNGDLTPSASNTPIHEIKTDAKKQLIELFHESDSDGSEDEPSIFDLPQNSANKSLSYESVADIVFRSVTVPKTNSNPSRTRKATLFAQYCCLPKLVRSLSCSERKRR
ncbi:hypothetical protein ACFX15_020872 [Malus domestica]|uniref:uncharacterized protein isoform X1 n=1 Tax=Malus domestica TaxID=3750 RepID=UPI003976EBB1